MIFSWPQAFAAGPAVVGGKGWNLGRLHRYGFSVPDGGVIAVHVYNQLLDTLGIELEQLAGIDADSVLDASAAALLEDTRSRLTSASLPESVAHALDSFLDLRGLALAPLAVRSSASTEDGSAASFAGIHQSFLNVRGREAVHAAVLGCFASLWTPQAVAYRRRMGFLDRELGCAVVLCRMVHAPGSAEPASAGVAFSADPHGGRRDVVVINAARGMGEKVVLGSVQPDQVELRVHGNNLCALARAASGQAALTPAQETELAGLVWRIHWALGDGHDPQDVEWAHDGTKFWIVQSRPVTGLPLHTFEPVRKLPVIWSTANIKDAVPGVGTMLSWSMLNSMVDRVMFSAPREVGYPVPDGMRTLKRIDGRAFFDLTAMQWWTFDLTGYRPHQTVESVGGHQPEIPLPDGDPMRGPDGKRRKRYAMRLAKLLWKLGKRFPPASREHHAYCKSLRRRELAGVGDSELLAVKRELDRRSHEIGPMVGLTVARTGLFQLPLEALLKRWFGDRAHSVLWRLLTGGGGITSAEHGYAIHDLAELARAEPGARLALQSADADPREALPPTSPFRRALEDYLDEFGHRAIYEAEMSNPRWAEDPRFVLEQIRVHLEQPAGPDPRAAARAVSREAMAEVRRKTLLLRPLVKWLTGKAVGAYAMREEGKSALAVSAYATRHVVLEIARRMVQRGLIASPDHVFHFSSYELDSFLAGEWDGAGARELAEDRARQRAELQQRPEPLDVIIEGDTALLAQSANLVARAHHKGGWRGLAVSSGVHAGAARALRHPGDGARLKRGDVLVAPSTDPGWTPLFLRAGALVMETGGFLSHGSIVAREYGIPAVVNIPGALGLLPDGETVLVDGDEGHVMPEARPSPLVG